MKIETLIRYISFAIFLCLGLLFIVKAFKKKDIKTTMLNTYRPSPKKFGKIYFIGLAILLIYAAIALLIPKLSGK